MKLIVPGIVRCWFCCQLLSCSRFLWQWKLRKVVGGVALYHTRGQLILRKSKHSFVGRLVVAKFFLVDLITKLVSTPPPPSTYWRRSFLSFCSVSKLTGVRDTPPQTHFGTFMLYLIWKLLAALHVWWPLEQIKSDPTLQPYRFHCPYFLFPLVLTGRSRSGVYLASIRCGFGFCAECGQKPKFSNGKCLVSLFPLLSTETHMKIQVQETEPICLCLPQPWTDVYALFRAQRQWT